MKAKRRFIGACPKKKRFPFRSLSLADRLLVDLSLNSAIIHPAIISILHTLVDHAVHTVFIEFVDTSSTFTVIAFISINVTGNKRTIAARAHLVFYGITRLLNLDPLDPRCPVGLDDTTRKRQGHTILYHSLHYTPSS